MPGWAAPFNKNLEMRGFAEHRRHPAGNTFASSLSKYAGLATPVLSDPCDPVIVELAQHFRRHRKSPLANFGPTDTEACTCAAAIYTAFSTVFQAWFEDKTLDHFQPALLKTALETEFSTKINPAVIICTKVFTGDLWAKVEQVWFNIFSASR